jgi:hypothetical protein
VQQDLRLQQEPWPHLVIPSRPPVAIQIPKCEQPAVPLVTFLI